MDERRHNPISEEMQALLVATITEAVRSELANVSVPLEIHKRHHEYLKAELEALAVRRVRNEKIKTSVLGWLVITVLGGIGTLAYQLFTTAKEHWK